MKQLILSSLLVFLTLGCGQQSGLDTEDQPVTEANYLGSWQRGCVSESDGGVKSGVVFGGSVALTVWRTDTTYNDTGCADQKLIVSRYGGAAQVTAADAGFNVDIDGLQIFFSPQSSVMADTLNAQNYCGYSDWALNQEKEVTGQNCGGVVMASKYYSIFKIENDQLAVGKFDGTHDGTTVAKRPVAYEPQFFSRAR